MRCLRKFQWVKLFRDKLPDGKGILGLWAKLAACAAYRKGTSLYCGFENEVEAGSWVGGLVGVKSILGLKNRQQTLDVLDKLVGLGYIEYEIEQKTKKLTYRMVDLVLNCEGAGCGAVYAVDKYGFICVPRTITERLVEKNYIFEESDAWLDLWCHTVSQDPSNAFSFLSASVQYKNDAFLTLETLGKRWGWEKTKVWRFFKKYRDVFYLHRLPGSYGCLIFNRLYPCDAKGEVPTREDVDKIMSGEKEVLTDNKNRVALFAPIIRAYLSPCWCCKYCGYDCKGNIPIKLVITDNIRGPCELIMGKLNFRRFIMSKNNSELVMELSTEEIIRILKRKGLVVSIEGKNKVADAREEFENKVFHNTELLLKQYRTIKWLIERFPSQVEEELSASFTNFDDLMLKLGIEERAYGNYKIKGRMKSLAKTRMIMEYINESISVLKKKPGNGELLYRIIYLTYISDEEQDVKDISYSLDLSDRHYFRLKSEAIKTISMHLWAAPTAELEKWLDALESVNKKVCG